MVGEVEDPDRAADEKTRALRARRLHFYLRNGYRETALTSRVFGVDYRLLEIPTGAPHSTEELRRVYTDLYRSILPPVFFKTQFQVSVISDGNA